MTEKAAVTGQPAGTATTEPEVLWEPTSDWLDRARMTAFLRWLREHRDLDLAGYPALWQWSVDDLPGFWSALAQFLDLHGLTGDQPVLADGERMPGARWFPQARVNYAQALLYPPAGVVADDVAVVFAREDGLRRELTWGDLRAQVAAVRGWLRRHGVARGDRVAAVVPNSPEALVAMLATASLGAVWSSCSPDFGPRGVADRFTQIEPAVLVAVDGYRYGGKAFDIRPTVQALRGQLPSLRATALIGYLDPDATAPDAATWAEVMATPGEEAFEAVPFDHPLWILYSSGTTGLPKPIVHGHGGMLIEHAKQLALHLDLDRGDRFFWFSTTGWMMWNLLVSGLAVGATIVLYDGSPTHPDADALWRLAEDVGITCLGVSAPYLQACLKAGLHPGRDHALSALRAIGSTGAPLPPEGFHWVYAEVKADLMLSSLSGGTDVCTAFVGGAPLLPVRAGEIPGRCLGARVEAYDEAGRPVVGQVGELVVTAPMPSFPVAFWNDPDGSRLREAYFDTYPGVWRHGDWILITERGSCVIYGRSDATLNRGGVRMGTAEFYRVVEDLAEVDDALVVDTSAAGVEGRLLLFVVLHPGASLEEVAATLRRRIRSELSPRHVPDEVVAVPEVPRTLNGKKCELPVKRVLAGTPLHVAVSEGALKDPRAMDVFVARAGGSTTSGERS